MAGPLLSLWKDMKRRNLGIGLFLGIGLLVISVLLIGIGVFAIGSGSTSSGDVTSVEAALRPSPTTTTEPPTATPSAAPEATTSTEQTVPVVQQISPPTGLRIKGLDVDAPVDAYGVDANTGQMDVPDNTTDVGWYKFGPLPGESGSAVLAAHVDLAGSGPGVFFDLDTLEAGDPVVVLHEDGTESPFRVVARVTYDKQELPLDVIFSREGPPVLTLITCGGAFNSNISRYDSNVVVYAVPDLGTAPAGGSNL